MGFGRGVDAAEGQGADVACVDLGVGADEAVDECLDMPIVCELQSSADDCVIAADEDVADMAAVGVGRKGQVALEGHRTGVAQVDMGIGGYIARNQATGIDIVSIGIAIMDCLADVRIAADDADEPDMLAHGVGGKADGSERQRADIACLDRGQAIDAAMDPGIGLAVVAGIGDADIGIVAVGLDAADVAAVGIGRDDQLALEGRLGPAQLHKRTSADIAGNRAMGRGVANTVSPSAVATPTCA